MTEPFDVAILGAGSAGYACALRAAQLGLSVVLVDEGPVGGTCLHRGCIPTKSWLQAAKARQAVISAPAFGVGAELGAVDAAAILGYADGVVGQLHKGLQGLIASRGIKVVNARGSLVTDARGPGIDVDGSVLRARSVVVATGAEPVTLGLAVDEMLGVGVTGWGVAQPGSCRPVACTMPKPPTASRAHAPSTPTVRRVASNTSRIRIAPKRKSVSFGRTARRTKSSRFRIGYAETTAAAIASTTLTPKSSQLMPPSRVRFHGYMRKVNTSAAPRNAVR